VGLRVKLDADVAAHFHDSATVNDALRELAKIVERAIKNKARVGPTSYQ